MTSKEVLRISKVMAVSGPFEVIKCPGVPGGSGEIRKTQHKFAEVETNNTKTTNMAGLDAGKSRTFTKTCCCPNVKLRVNPKAEPTGCLYT